MKKVNLQELKADVQDVSLEQLDEINGGCKVKLHFICNGRELASLYVNAGAQYRNCTCGHVVQDVYTDYSAYPNYCKAMASGNYWYLGWPGDPSPTGGGTLPEAAYYQKYGKWPK